MRRFLTIVIIVACGVGFYFFSQQIPKPIEEGLQAPPFAPADAYRGKVILLNFWATWCPPCLEEMPSLEALYQKFSDQDFVVVSVNRDSDRLDISEERVSNYLKGVSLTFPILYDTDGKTAQAYGVSPMPVSFLIGRDGKIVKRILGARDWTSPQHFTMIEEILR